MTESERRPIVDFTDAEARRALVLKWGSVPDDILPAWVAEMDYAIDPVVHAAVRQAIDDGVTGYPVFDPYGGELGRAYSEWARRRFGSVVDPDQVLPVSDVTAGVRVALDLLSDPGPMIFPTPGYNAQFGLAGVTGREQVDLPVSPDEERAAIDLDRLDAAFAAGARTLLLTQPHNPWGRVFTREELEGIRDVVVRHGGRVISDEIHAPLVLDGEQVSYLSIDGAADHAVAVVAASKAFNTAGLRCAQIVAGNDGTRDRLIDTAMSRNDSWSPLGVIAAISAYRDGDPWLDSLVDRLRSQRDLLVELLADRLPKARMRPVEATYLGWVDLRHYGDPDPAGTIERVGRVKLGDGGVYGGPGHVRINFATSVERLTRIVDGMARSFRS